MSLRHGDTTKKERLRQSKTPPDILITTPETLQIMLLGSRLRRHLARVRAIVIDEVHDIASSERGSQLLVGIQRIRALAGREIQIVGLLQQLGTQMRVPVGFPKRSSSRRTIATINRGFSSRGATIQRTRHWQSLGCISGYILTEEAHHLIKTSSPALVFVNSRSNAEQ